MIFLKQRTVIVQRVVLLPMVLLLLLAPVACGGMLPDLPSFREPTPTFTPTPVPTPTPTPVPQSVGAAAASDALAASPTPQVVIPTGFTVVQDQRLDYSFAVPTGWTALDLQGAQFRTMAGMVGMGEQVDQVNEFLASPEGQIIGLIYITDLMSAMFGGFPTILNVSVVDAPGYTAEGARDLVQEVIETNMGVLGEVEIGAIEAATINNLPAVRTTATANLAAVGMDTTVFAKVVGLVANQKIYVMTLAAQGNQQAAKEPIFDQIIGSFRPE
jgi:hypothetical protein